MNALSVAVDMTEEARCLKRLLEHLAPATCRAYRLAWAHYVAHCRSNGFDPLRVSDDFISRYAYGLFHDEGLSAATVLHRLSVVAGVFRCTGLADPRHLFAISQSVRNLRRRCRNTPKPEPLSSGDIAEMLTLPCRDLRDLRDRAMVMVGFAGAFSAAELSALRTGQCVPDAVGGYSVTIASGRAAHLPCELTGLRPADTLRAWLAVCGTAEAPLFRPIGRTGILSPLPLSVRTIGEIIKKCARRIGKDPSRYAGSSLKRGRDAPDVQKTMHANTEPLQKR